MEKNVTRGQIAPMMSVLRPIAQRVMVMAITMQHVSQKLMIHSVQTHARNESLSISNVKTWSAKNLKGLEKIPVASRVIVRSVAMA
tara:strand:- start:8 stop:265 length:258 start_codon:yes stop_codon:yes gene_type:complete